MSGGEKTTDRLLSRLYMAGIKYRSLHSLVFGDFNQSSKVIKAMNRVQGKYDL